MASYSSFVSIFLEYLCMRVLCVAATIFFLSPLFYPAVLLFPLNCAIVSLDFCDCLILLLIIGLLLLQRNSFWKANLETLL